MVLLKYPRHHTPPSVRSERSKPKNRLQVKSVKSTTPHPGGGWVRPPRPYLRRRVVAGYFSRTRLATELWLEIMLYQTAANLLTNLKRCIDKSAKRSNLGFWDWSSCLACKASAAACRLVCTPSPPIALFSSSCSHMRLAYSNRACNSKFALLRCWSIASWEETEKKFNRGFFK